MRLKSGVLTVHWRDGRVEAMHEQVAKAREKMPLVVERTRERLRKRLEEVMGERGIEFANGRSE